VPAPPTPFERLVVACAGADGDRQQLREYLALPHSGVTSVLEKEGLDFDTALGAFAADFKAWSSTTRQPATAAAASASTGEKVGCDIGETALRGITIPQLEAFFDQAVAQCTAEGWTSTAPGKERELLSRETITLYDLAKRVIAPLAQRTQRSVVETVASGPQPAAWFVSHWWGEPVADFIRCLRQHREDHRLPEDTCYWVRAAAPTARHRARQRAAGGLAARGASGARGIALRPPGQRAAVRGSAALCLLRVPRRCAPTRCGRARWRRSWRRAWTTRPSCARCCWRTAP